MNRSIKLICLCSILLSFSFCVAAQPLYQFSGFGGGLPSSAIKLSAEDNSTLSEELDKELEELTNQPKEKMPAKKKAIIITASVIGGLVIIGGLAVGGYFLKTEISKCCQSATEDCAQQTCQNSTQQACENATGGGIIDFALNLASFPIYVP